MQSLPGVRAARIQHMLIDLTFPVNEHTPVYPGDPRIEIRQGGTVAADGYRDHLIQFGTHVGTHIDAPSHMIEDGKSLDEYPLSRFVGRGVLLCADGEFTLTQVENADIRAGDVVLFETGTSARYYEPTYFTDYPVLTEEIARYLVEKKVGIVGVDTCGPDKEPFPVHKILLKNDVLIIENVANLDQLREQSLPGKEFKVFALPLNLATDGAPVRVMAEV